MSGARDFAGAGDVGRAIDAQRQERLPAWAGSDVDAPAAASEPVPSMSRLKWTMAQRARRSSLRAEDAIARVAEARADVAALVELAVDRRAPDRHVRVRLAHRREPLRGGDQADVAH